MNTSIIVLTPYEASEKLANTLAITQSILCTLEATGEDLHEGFTVPHKDVMNVLDSLAEDLKKIDRLSKHIARIACTPF
jgi:hypothetical protein